MPKLVVNSNGHVLGEFPVDKDRMVIGSKASNDIPLDNVNADKEHAVITRCGDLYVIEDLGSANGTFVHDRKITKLLLNDADLISVGTCQLRFVEDDAADARPAANKAQARESDKQERMPTPPRTTAPDALMSAESKTGDRLEVYDKKVVIKRKMGIKVLLQSLKGDLLEGIKGDKNIPIDSIASIQFKPASTLLAGYITIVLPESKEGFKLAGLDDYTVEFVKREEPKFLEIKAFLDARIGR
ncbi:MAG: FHA domain-containing protein [Sulfuritalea sp.]|nr:FHA domain-containing protein [Sulfuritalea sp.]